MDDHTLVFDEDACNSARFTSEISSLTYSPSTNCMIALVKEHIQIIDASTGILLRSTPPIDHHLPSSDETSPTTLLPPSTPPSRLQHCTIHPKVDKLVVTGHRMVGARKHINGAYLLHTILDTPLKLEKDEVTLEMELSWGQTVLAGLQELRASNANLLPEDMDNVIEQLTRDTQRAKKVDSPSLKTSKWQVCILRGPLVTLQNLFDEVIRQLSSNAKTKNTSVVPLLSALRYRVASMDTACIEEYKIDVTQYNSKWKQVMHVEDLRLQTFSQWPHKNYKWATPEAMAGAGFFYEPTGSDRAVCFQCGICLLYWEPTDEPWSEHERHSTCCPYVMGRFTENVPLLISDATSPAQQHFSTQLISCWSSVHECSFWGSGSRDGVVTLWDLQHGFSPLRLLQLGQYDVNRLDRHKAVFFEANCFVEVTEQLSHPEISPIPTPPPPADVPSPPPNLPEIEKDPPKKADKDVQTSEDLTALETKKSMLLSFIESKSKANAATDAEDTKTTDPDSKDSKSSETAVAPESKDVKSSETAATPDTKDVKNSETAVAPDSKDSKSSETAVAPGSKDGKSSETAATLESKDGKSSETAATPDSKDSKATSEVKAHDPTTPPHGQTAPVPLTNEAESPAISDGNEAKPTATVDEASKPSDEVSISSDSQETHSGDVETVPGATPAAQNEKSDELDKMDAEGDQTEKPSSSSESATLTSASSDPKHSQTSPTKPAAVELADFSGELTAICLASLGEPEVLKTQLTQGKKPGSGKPSEETYVESQIPTYLISAMTGSGKDENQVLLQLHRVSKQLLPPNIISGNPATMNVVSNLSFDSEEDEINDLLMLVPQNAESADESGTIDIEDTTESSTSSILQNEDTDTGPALNPLHTQSILLQVPAALHGCSVEQILVEKAGTILCLVLKWKQDGDDKGTGAVLFYRIISYEQSVYINTPIALLPFKDKTFSFSHFTVLPFESKASGETTAQLKSEQKQESSDEEDVMFIKSLFEETEYPIDKYKWLNSKTEKFKQNNSIVAGINSEGDLCLLNLMNLTLICKIEKDSKENPFTHLTYCKGLERIAAVSLDGVLRLYHPQGPLFTLNSPTTEQVASAGGYEMDQEFLSSPLTYEKLKTLCVSYQGQILETRPNMSPPLGWRETKPEQQNRRNPLHVHQQTKREQSRLCWQYKPSDSQKDTQNRPHLFELTLLQASPLSHIEVKFYLHNHIDLQGDLMVSLLAPVSAKDASESKENKIEGANDTVCIAGLKLRYLSGPIKIQACLDATGSSGLAYLASPQLLSIKGRTLYVVIHDPNMGEGGDDIQMLDGKEKTDEEKEKGKEKENKEGKDPKDEKNEKESKDKDTKEKKKEKEFPIETIYITIYQPNSSVTATHLLTLRSYVRDEKLQAALLKIAIRQPQEDEVTVQLDQLDEMQLMALDLCSWIAGMQAHDAAPIPSFPKVVSEYLKSLLESCLLHGTRETAHKCVRLIATLLKSEDSSDGPPSNHTHFLHSLNSALLSLLTTMPSEVCFPVGVAWLFKLLNFLSLTFHSDHTAPVLVDLLALCLSKLSNQFESLHAVLCSKFDLYGTPLDPYIWDAPLPSLKYTPPPPKPPGSTTTTTTPQVTYILDLSSVKGITSYVHDDLSKMLQHTTGGSNTSSTATPATPTSTASNTNISKKFQVPVTPLTEYLAYSAIGLIDSHPLLLKVVPNLKNCTCNILDKDKDILSDMKKTGPDINTGREVDSVQFAGGSDTGPCDYIEHLIDRLSSLLSHNPSQTEMPPLEEFYVPHQAAQLNLPTVYSTVPDLHRWLLQQPKQFMLTVDSVQSGAVYYATFAMEYAVELTDFFIPPCEYMSSVAVDVWDEGDADNPTRLGSTNDFSTKAFVLSNISPPPLCKFVKVSLGGKLGSGGALAKVNMGVFFGRPPLPPQYARDSLPIQVETLRLIRTEYQSHRHKLMALLQTIQHIDNGNLPTDAKLEIEQAYHKCCWFRLQMNRLRRMIERTCATAHISLGETAPTESLLSPTSPSSPLPSPLIVPDNYLNLIVECVVDTILTTCFNSHAKGLDLNINAPFAKQDGILLGDDEDDEKDVYGELVPEDHTTLLTLDRSLCESLFYKSCLVARPEVLVKVSSLLITTSSAQHWWPEFIAGLLKNLFSIGMSRVVVKDRVFLIVSYMAEMSPGTSQIIECLSKILSDLLPVYTEGVQDELGFCMPAIADIQLLSWGLLLLLRLLERYYTQPPTSKLKDTTSTSTTTPSTAASKSSKWDFILPGTNLEHPPSNKTGQLSVAKPSGASGAPPSLDTVTSDEEKKERHRISRIVTMHKQRVEELRLQYQSLYTEYQLMKEKMKEGESHPSVQTIYSKLKRIKHTAKKHYKDAMTLRFQRACLLVRKFERKLASVKAKLPASEQGEQDVDQSCFIPYDVCSPLAKSLVRLLLAMDSTYHLDLYLIACKILSKISLISIPTLSIHDLFSKDQLNLLLTRALTNPENIVPLIPTPTKGTQWASHTLRCLFINILYSEFVTGPNRHKALSDHSTKSSPVIEEGNQELNRSPTPEGETPVGEQSAETDITQLHSTKQQHIQVIDKLMRRLKKIKGKAEKLGVKIEVPDEFESLLQRGSPTSQTIKLTEQYSKVIDDRLSNTFDYFAETQLQLLAKEEAESLANALSEGTQAPSANQAVVYPQKKLSLTEMQFSISKSGELIYQTFSSLLAESSDNPFTNFSLELFLELWVDMLDAISYNSSLNKEEKEQVTYIAETLHLNELIVQLLKYVVNSESLSSRAWWLFFKITYYTCILPLEIKQDNMMLLVDVYLNFLTGNTSVPMEGHHEELISDPTGTLSLVLETFSSISQLNKCGEEVEVWQGVMFTVLFKLFASRDRLARLSQGEALTLMIKSLQADLKHPLNNQFVSPTDLTEFARNSVNYVANMLNHSCPVFCRSEAANNSYWQKKINKIKFFPDAFSPIRLCATLITFLQKLITLYLDSYVSPNDNSTKETKVKNAPVDINLEEFFALCLSDASEETSAASQDHPEDNELELEELKNLEEKKKKQEEEATKQLSDKVTGYVADKYMITDIITSNPDTIRLLLHILNRFGQLPDIYKNMAKEKKEKATAYTTETESNLFHLHSKVTQFMSTLISHTPVHKMDRLYGPLAHFLKQNSQQSVHMPYLSDSILEFANTLLSYQSCAEGFLNLGSLTPVMTGLMRSSKLCLNHSCGPLSDTITTLGGGANQARVEDGTGLLHFSGKASIIVNDTNGLMCTGMLQNLLSQRVARSRTAAWHCQFRDYPKAWVTLYIYLPHPILLHVVQLNVQNTTYQYCPSYVAIDISRNLGCEPDIPVATPIRTSGLGVIRIELTHPEVVQALHIHLCKPRDFQSITLSTISLLGTSLYTDIAETPPDTKPLTEVYPPHASYPWIQLLCKLLITHSNLAPDIVRTSMQSANMLNTLVSFLTAPVSLSGLQQIEAILLTLAEHSKEIAMQLTHLLLHPNYFKLTNPPHYLDTSQGQPLSTITTSFMHLLFHLTVATNEVSIERLKTFINYAKPRILVIEKHSECLPEMVHVLSTSVWTSKKIGTVSFINDIISKEDLLGIIKSAQSPAISIGMKRAVDLLLCSLCYAFPPYFTIILQQSEEILLNPDTKQVTNFASLLGTLSCASQSLSAVQALLDSAICSQFCHRLQVLFESLIDQNMSLLDREGLSLEDAPLILQFFSQIADDQSLMKDWIGSEDARKFWLSLLEFLCLPAMATETLNLAVFRSCQDAALNFFLSVSRHHVKNQRIVVEMLCNALKKAIISIREGAVHSNSKGSFLPPFVQSLVLHFILESEIVKIYLMPRKQGKLGEDKSFISLGKFMPTLSYYIGNNLVKVTECNLEHPRYGCGHGRYLVYVRSSTTIDSFSNSFKLVSQYMHNEEGSQQTKLHAPSSPIKTPIQPEIKAEESLVKIISLLNENSSDSVLADLVINSGLTYNFLPVESGKPAKKKEPAIYTKKVVFFKNDTPKSMPISSKSPILKIEKTTKGKSPIDSSNHIHLYFEFGEGEKKAVDSNETIIPTQMELFASCGGLTLLAEYLPLIYPNYWPRTEHLFENNKAQKPVYPDLIKGSLTSAEANISTILPLNSIILLGLCLKIEEISEPLLAYPFITKCMLRLLFGAEDDGNGKPISKLGDTIIKVLPLQPYYIIKQLLDSKLDQATSQTLRDRVYHVGIVHHILHCIAVMGHHDSRNPSQDLAASTTLSIDKSPNKAQGETEGGKLYWEKGTGFGTGSTTSKWNLEDMVAKQKIEERHITFCLNILASYLGEVITEPDKSDTAQIYCIPDGLNELFGNSCLLPALESYLRNDSVLDMSRHVPLYTALMAFIKKFVSVPAFIPLMLPLDSESNNYLHKHLITMNDVVKTYLKQVAKTDKSPSKAGKPNPAAKLPTPTATEPNLPFSSVMLQYIEHTVGTNKQDEPADPESLNFFLEEVQKTAELAAAKVKAFQKEEKESGKVVSKIVGKDYMSQMGPLQFGSWKLVTEKNGSVTFTHPFYWSSRVQTNISNPRRARRLAQEISALATSLPLSTSSSVFVQVDEDRLDVMKVLITGPEDTPYGNGCFIFDIYFTADYPGSPMLVQLETTGQRTIRFNPNLYNDGKVCLSILNTWHGRPEERWNSQSSSFLQVLVSVQSLILVPEPYFNEPGYEQSRGTANGTQRSQEYNANITQATARWAILEQMKNPPPCFKKVIMKHFYIKKDCVVEICESWVTDLKNYIKSRSLSSTSTVSQHLKSLQSHIKQIRVELDKVDPKDFADSGSEDEAEQTTEKKKDEPKEKKDESKEKKDESKEKTP